MLKIFIILYYQIHLIMIMDDTQIVQENIESSYILG